MSESEAKPETAKDPLVGQQIAGRYRIEERLAAGGMGVVYRAQQEPLGRAVAIKVLRRPEDPRLDKSYAERFLREAAVVANLNHPNTVVVYDYGNDGPHLYFAMEFLDGQTLTQRVFERGPIPPADVVRIGRQIASSLGDAHDQGLVHRDLKPGNIMICPRSHEPLFIKVLDFGLVKLVTEEQAKKLTQSGIMMGSPRYMSPEQVRGLGAIDRRADIYSFGALMTFCLAGRPPFPDGSQFEAMRHQVYTAPPALRTLNPQCTVSDELEAVVLRCLEKEPERRFQSMGEVLAAFGQCPEAVGQSGDYGPTSGDDGRTSVDLLPPGASAAPPGPIGSDSQISQISQSWLRRADGSSLDASGWLVRGLVAFTIVLAGAAAAFFVPQLVEPAARPAVPPLPPLPTPAPEPPPEPDPPPSNETVTVQPVRIVTDPPGASVRHGEATLGDTPVDLEVARGEVWTLEIERRGFAAERIRIDGTQDLIHVELHPDSEPATMRREPTMRSEPTMGSEPTDDGMNGPTRIIRDPWAG